MRFNDYWKWAVQFNPDNGAGNGGGQTGDATGTGDAGGEKTPGQGDPENGGKKTLTLTEEEFQAKINAAVQDRLNREKAKNEKDQARIKQEAEQAKLEAAKDWETLATTQKARITELEAEAAKVTTAQTEATRYKEALMARVKADREGLPAHIIVLLDKLDPIEQLEYIGKNAAALKGTATGTQQQNAGPGPSPKQGNQKQLSDDQIKAAQQAQGRFTANMF